MANQLPVLEGGGEWRRRYVPQPELLASPDFRLPPEPEALKRIAGAVLYILPSRHLVGRVN